MRRVSRSTHRCSVLRRPCAFRRRRHSIWWIVRPRPSGRGTRVSLSESPGRPRRRGTTSSGSFRSDVPGCFRAPSFSRFVSDVRSGLAAGRSRSPSGRRRTSALFFPFGIVRTRRRGIEPRRRGIEPRRRVFASTRSRTPRARKREARLRRSEDGNGAGEGNRTLVVSLEGFCSTIELRPRFRFFDRACRRRLVV